MNKENIRQAIISELERQLQLATKAADEARELATHEQSQPETQYDTVGLEASYLAHGQSQRVFDLQQTVQQYKKLTLKAFTEDDEVGMTCLVSILYPDHSTKWFFIGPQAGGLEVKIDQMVIHLITPDAPIGRQMIGLYEGEQFSINEGSPLLEIASVS